MFLYAFAHLFSPRLSWNAFSFAHLASRKGLFGWRRKPNNIAFTLLCCKFSDFNAFISVSNDFFNNWGSLDCYLWLCSELQFYQALQRLYSAEVALANIWCGFEVVLGWCVLKLLPFYVCINYEAICRLCRLRLDSPSALSKCLRRSHRVIDAYLIYLGTTFPDIVRTIIHKNLSLTR